MMQSHLSRMHEFLRLTINASFAEISQTIVVTHHTYVHLPFEHRSKAIDRQC